MEQLKFSQPFTDWLKTEGLRLKTSLLKLKKEGNFLQLVVTGVFEGALRYRCGREVTSVTEGDKVISFSGKSFKQTQTTSQLEQSVRDGFAR